jgi:hypothetical protein
MRFRLATRWGLSLVLAVPAAFSFGQNRPPDLPPSSIQSAPGSDDSLAAVARRAKSNKSAVAKKVITDDDIKATIGPLPRLKMKEAENGEAVIAAITSYKQNHSAEQTEEAVRRWFDEYDKDLEKAIQSNIEIKAVRGANVRNAYVLCENDQDYYECQKRRVAETDGARYDQAEIARNSEWIVRLQHSLMNIKNRLPQIGLHYDWFKVRTTNNIDRF